MYNILEIFEKKKWVIRIDGNSAEIITSQQNTQISSRFIKLRGENFM